MAEQSSAAVPQKRLHARDQILEKPYLSGNGITFETVVTLYKCELPCLMETEHTAEANDSTSEVQWQTVVSGVPAVTSDRGTLGLHICDVSSGDSLHKFIIQSGSCYSELDAHFHAFVETQETDKIHCFGISFPDEAAAKKLLRAVKQIIPLADLSLSELDISLPKQGKFEDEGCKGKRAVEDNTDCMIIECKDTQAKGNVMDDMYRAYKMAASAEVVASDLYPSMLDACGSGDVSYATFFLNQGLDVNYVDQEGTFPLLLASSFGKVSMVKFLLEQGANVDVVNSQGESSLSKAKQHGWKEVVDLLQEYGAKDVMKGVIDSNTLGQPSSDQNFSLLIKPTLQELVQVLYPAASKWLNIGVMLGVPLRVLDNIKRDYPNLVRDCLREMLKVWLKQVDPPPTWSSMVDALEVLDPYLAYKIKRLKEVNYSL